MSESGYPPPTGFDIVNVGTPDGPAPDVGDVNISGEFKINGTAIATGGGVAFIGGTSGSIAAVETITFAGGALTGTAGAATMNLGAGAIAPGTSALIASAIGVDLNTAGDTAMTLSAFATGKFFVVDYVLVTNPSIALDTAVADVWSGAGGTGQQYSNVGPAFTGILNNPRDWIVGQGSAAAGPTAATLTSIASFGTMLNTAPIVHVSTPQGSAATADFYVYGRVFT